jgi:hypothetical protein
MRALHTRRDEKRGARPGAGRGDAPAEGVSDLITQSRALNPQRKHAEGLPFFQLAIQAGPKSYSGRFNLDYTTYEMEPSSGLWLRLSGSLLSTPALGVGLRRPCVLMVGRRPPKPTLRWRVVCRDCHDSSPACSGEGNAGKDRRRH